MSTSTKRRQAPDDGRSRRLDILVLYCAYTTRANLLDSLYSFRNHTSHRVYYLNIRARRIPKFVSTLAFDLIVFHTLFFSSKFDRCRQLETFDKAYVLSATSGRKVLTPQDEFINNDIVCDFASRIGADVICSVLPPACWGTVYDSVDTTKTELRSVLTGYLDAKRVRRYERFLAKGWSRGIVVGYRTNGSPAPWFGRHGYLKERIAQELEPAFRRAGVGCNISTQGKDALSGAAWYDFLGDCQYVLGVEGGTSLYDKDGSIRRATDEFVRERPDASFDEIEAGCFPGMDGHFNGFAISPRHLEACMTGTCQILTEGDYNGILKPNVHYIPVAKDLHDAETVVQTVKEGSARARIVESAYRDIVLSGKYHLDQYTTAVIGDLSSYPTKKLRIAERIALSVAYSILSVVDACDRVIATCWVYLKRYRPA